MTFCPPPSHGTQATTARREAAVLGPHCRRARQRASGPPGASVDAFALRTTARSSGSCRGRLIAVADVGYDEFGQQVRAEYGIAQDYGRGITYTELPSGILGAKSYKLLQHRTILIEPRKPEDGAQETK